MKNINSLIIIVNEVDIAAPMIPNIGIRVIFKMIFVIAENEFT